MKLLRLLLSMLGSICCIVLLIQQTGKATNCDYTCPTTTVCSGENTETCSGCYDPEAEGIPAECTAQAGRKEWNPDGVIWRGSALGGTKKKAPNSAVCYRTWACSASYQGHHHCSGLGYCTWFNYPEKYCYYCGLSGSAVDHVINNTVCYNCNEE